MKKGYNLSIDMDIMEQFKTKVPKGKMSDEVERILVAYNEGKLIFANEIDDRAKLIVDDIKLLSNSLQGSLNLLDGGIQNEDYEPNDFDMGDFDE